MCPGHVPGSRSDKVSERSTTLAPASDAKSNTPPSPIEHPPPGRAVREPPYAQNPSKYPSVSKRSPWGSPTTSASAFCSTSSTRFSETYRCSRCSVFGMRTKRVSSGGTPQLQRTAVRSASSSLARTMGTFARSIKVLVTTLAFDLAGQPLRRQVGETDSQGVAVRLLADVADDHVFDGGRLRLLDAEDAEASDHVRVHPRPRVVLAQSVDVEHVYIRDGEIRHHLHVLGEQLHLTLVDPSRRYRLDDGRFVVGVLDGRHPEEDVARLQHLIPDLDHEVADALDAEAVQRERLLVLAEPDRGHLH